MSGSENAALASGAAFRSAHARYARHTALKLGYDFRSLDGADGYLFEVRDGARRAYFSAGPGAPYALNRANAHSIARDKAFTQAVLAREGLPIIPSRLFFANSQHAALRDPGREPADALVFARNAAFPLFCKPISGAQGAFAEIVRDTGQFERYIARVAAAHYAVLVQPVIEAPEHRVFVLEGKVLFSYRKSAPRLLGDGTRSLADLFGRATAPPRPDEIEARASETLSARDQSGAFYSADDVPPAGRLVTLLGAANRARGGGAVDLGTDAPQALAELARACAAALQLGVAAVDIFERGDGGPLVIEVNASPAIKTLEDHGRWDLIETIWRANFAAALQ